MCLLFEPGSRPRACDVESSFVNVPIGRGTENGISGYGISGSGIDASANASHSNTLHAMVVGAHGAGLGSIELLVNGLSYDLIGLSPSTPCEIPQGRHFFGLPREIAHSSFEAVVLQPGPHLATARAMIPVVKSMVALAADLAKRLGASVVCWQPAGSWMDPGYFSRTSSAWQLHSVFPALGLTTITMRDDGIFESDGLAYFTGQNLRFFSRKGESPAESVKYAVRLINSMVTRGQIVSPEKITGPDGVTVFLEPTANGTIVNAKHLG